MVDGDVVKMMMMMKLREDGDTGYLEDAKYKKIKKKVLWLSK